MENLKTDLDARALQLEARENAAQFRAMSFCQVESRADSQSSYSDDEGGGRMPADHLMLHRSDSIESLFEAEVVEQKAATTPGTPVVEPSETEKKKCSMM
mmetsp:Transcript_19284/g.27153  ORF Transcript_19284/g.27153 Transcript_19284/m.27153 type:complete len:100 (+) Transcript_19284:1154-1453(+)